MATWNLFPEGITPLPRQRSNENTYKSNQIRKHSSKDNYNMNSRAQGDSFPPLFRKTIEEIHKILKAGKAISGNDVINVKKLLEDCYMDDPVCTYPDEYGYDMVQKSVAAGAIEILDHLVSNNYDLFLNSRSCSSALYLACKNQNDDMVKFLLDQGANMYHPSKSCYPKRHNVAFTGNSWSLRKRRNVCCLPGYDVQGCYSRRQIPSTLEERKWTPLYTAIKQDRKPIVEVLLHHQNEYEVCDGAALLEYACNVGAIGCMGILMKVFLKDFKHDSHKAGHYTSLMPFVSAAFTHSEQCGGAFIDEACNCDIKNEVLHAFCPMEKRNILHCIYREPTIHYLDITKKVVSGGFDCKNINQPDTMGNSPLHALVSQIAQQVTCSNPSGRNPNAKCGGNAEAIEEERQEQLFATVQYLVSLGADVTLVNNPGESVLHKLINSISCHGLRCYGESGYGTAVMNIQPKINRLLEYFVRKGVDVNHRSFYVSSVLSQLINNLSMFAASSLDAVWAHMWYTFNLLFKHNADPNIIDSRGISTVSMVLTTLHSWLQLCSSKGSHGADKDLPCRILEKVKDLLWLMFRHGLQPNDDVLQLSVKQVSIMCNITIEDEMFLTMVKDLLVPFFCHGVNPNKLDIIYDGENNAGVPCRLHAQFYTTRAFIIHNSGSYSIVPFFQIFLNTLEQEELNILLNGIHKTLRENFEKVLSQQMACLKRVEDLRQEVRSLKCLTRITIAQSLQWHLYERKKFLPLPKIMQQYLCDL